MVKSLSDLLNMDMGEVSDWLIENAHKFDLTPKPIFVDTPEDIEPCGEEVLCWDSCDWSIDYAEIDGETGNVYMANGTQVEAYIPLPPKLN